MSDTSRLRRGRVLERPSLTAEAVTLARAGEQRRPAEQRILDDPYARFFLRPSGRAALAAWSAAGPASDLIDRLASAFVVCRHRYIDDRLAAALDRGVEQVVLLGAGYDSRAYRFADQLDGRAVFEVDLPAASQRKARIIERNAKRFPATNVHRVEIDFETQTLEETLRPAGFAVGAPTFVVWEGVIMYLTRAAIKATVRALHDLCGNGSELAMDCWFLVDEPGPVGSARRAAPNAIALIGEPITFGMHPEDMPFFLKPLGFRVVDVADAAALERRYCTDGRSVEPSMFLMAARRTPTKQDT